MADSFTGSTTKTNNRPRNQILTKKTSAATQVGSATQTRPKQTWTRPKQTWTGTGTRTEARKTPRKASRRS